MIAIVSDTHENIPLIRKAIDHIQSILNRKAVNQTGNLFSKNRKTVDYTENL